MVQSCKHQTLFYKAYTFLFLFFLIWSLESRPSLPNHRKHRAFHNRALYSEQYLNADTCLNIRERGICIVFVQREAAPEELVFFKEKRREKVVLFLLCLFICFCENTALGDAPNNEIQSELWFLVIKIVDMKSESLPPLFLFIFSCRHRRPRVVECGRMWSRHVRWVEQLDPSALRFVTLPRVLSPTAKTDTHCYQARESDSLHYIFFLPRCSSGAYLFFFL